MHTIKLGLQCCAASLAICTYPAIAQTQPAGEPDAGAENSSADVSIAEVIVTAQKRSEALQDVPLAITAISGDSLAAKGIDSTLDVPLVTPGLTYTTVGGNASPRIRGVGAGLAYGGNENPVATYVDGVYYASASAAILSLDSVEQIAVLKGPQGTLFGRNATGGLIQITTRDPKQTPDGSVQATYGNLGTIGGDVYLTGGLTPAVAADLSVDYQNQQEGFGRNLTTGREIDKSKDFAARSKWKLDLGSDTTATLAADFANRKAIAPTRRPAYGSLPVSGVPFTDGPFDSRANVDSLFDNEQGGASANITHGFGGMDLVSITAYRESTTHYGFDIDSLPLSLLDFDAHLNDKQFSEEVQLISTDDGPFTWVAGLYYFNARGAVEMNRFGTPTSVLRFDSEQKTESIAGFAQGTYEFTPATHLTLGLRYTHETKDYDAAGVITPRAAVPPITPAPIAGQLEYKEPTWRIALDHKLDTDVMVYASYNRGFKSGGFTPTVFSVAPESYDPEKLDAYEVGIKSDYFSRRLLLNSSAFYFDYSGIQLSAFQGAVGGTGGLPRVFNAASAEIYGLDLDATALPIDRLTLTTGLSLIHARFGNFPNATLSVPNPTGGTRQIIGDATGNRLPMTPDWTLSFGADYDVPLPSGGLTLSVQYFHSDGWMAEVDNRREQKPYDLLNASILWRIGSDERFSVKLWGKNLTNEVYASQMSTQDTADTYTVAAGRTYAVTLGVDF